MDNTHLGPYVGYKQVVVAINEQQTGNWDNKKAMAARLYIDNKILGQ